MNLKSPELRDAYSMVRQQAQSNLIDFEIATGRDYQPNWHHLLIAKQLEHIETFGDRDYKILIVSVPPRHGKSQQCSVDFPAWFLGRNPSKEIIIASYSAELAQEFGGKTRDKVSSPAYGFVFPEVRLKEDEKARGRWKTLEGGGYVAAGVGGPITGRGADILLIDDPVKNREEAESEVMRNKNWDWFTSTAFTRLEPHGVVVIIHTRWHMDDLTGRILADEKLAKDTKHIVFPAVAVRDEKPYRDAGGVLWPARYDLPALNKIKAVIGPYDWSALYQGSPVLTEKQEFNPAWIKRIAEASVESMNCRRFLTIDTAMSKKTQADFTAFCDNRVNQENFWHIKAWEAKIGPEELVDALFSLHTTNHYEAIGIEKTAYLEGLKPYLDSEQRKRNKFLPIIELDHRQTAKEIRIRGVIPRYASGSIYHIDSQTKELEVQMATFPNGMHDDLLDALAYQLQIADGHQSGGMETYIPDLD